MVSSAFLSITFVSWLSCVSIEKFVINARLIAVNTHAIHLLLADCCKYLN